jgi:hypothetical protein
LTGAAKETPSTDGDGKKLTKEAKALQKLRRERLSLLSRLHDRKSRALKVKVVQLLAEEPETRDSDTLLAKRLFEVFYPQFIEDGYIQLKDLFDLPKPYDIQRYRAHIQNTLGLFRASPRIREARLKMQSKKHAEFSQDGEGPPLNTLTIACDESGKNGTFTVVAAFCTILVCEEEYIDLDEVKSDLGISSETKFGKVGRENISLFQNFFDLALAASLPNSVRPRYQLRMESVTGDALLFRRVVLPFLDDLLDEALGLIADRRGVFLRPSVRWLGLRDGLLDRIAAASELRRDLPNALAFLVKFPSDSMD